MPDMPDIFATLLPAILGGYVLGSLPFGVILARLFGHGDIRARGSGNIGATNILRTTGSKTLAAATLVLDAGKGGIAVLVTLALPDPAAGAVAGAAAGAAAVIGHNFPLWLRFRGGKGVATTLGVLAVLSWPVGLAAGVTWLIVAVLFRFSSLASLMALCAAPLYAWFLATPVLTLTAGGLALLAVIRHRENIRRLIAGSESRIGAPKN